MVLKSITDNCKGKRSDLMIDYSMEGISEPIELGPFAHQVGGHSSMFLLDDSTLCKPLIARELRFYETLPTELRKVTPQYRGVVEGSYQKDDAGYLSLIAHPVDSQSSPHTSPLSSPQRSLSPTTICHNDSIDEHSASPSCSSRNYPCESPNSSGAENSTTDSDSDSPSGPVRSSLSATLKRFRLQKGGGISIEGVSEYLRATRDAKRREKQVVSASGLNPWSLRCHKEQLVKMSESSEQSHQFILLENLASQFELPCILDLKMGQRQHGDDVSEDKKQRHIRMCQQTTSHQLGFRICGMQVYQANSGDFLCHNKYHGRFLDEEGVRSSLRQFLDNGLRLRIGLIGGIIEMLKALYSTLKKQHTFRFYSSSLLIMYEGMDSAHLLSSTDSEHEESNQSCFEGAGCSSLHSPKTDHNCSLASFTSSTSLSVDTAARSLHSNTAATPVVSFEDYSSNTASSNLSRNREQSQYCVCKRHDTLVSNAKDLGAGPSGMAMCSTCRYNAGHDRSLHTIDNQRTDSSYSSCSSADMVSLRESCARGAQAQLDASADSAIEADIHGRVDVRMIDFAHATHGGLDEDQTRHEGPDHGYLFGLKSLINMFNELRDQDALDGGGIPVD